MTTARTRLAIVITSFDPGGTERQMTELIARLDRTRFELNVVCFRRSGLWLPRVEEAADSLTHFPLTSFKSPSAFSQLRRFARWCTSRRIQVVHTCDFYANVFGLTGAALARVPVRIGSRRDILLPQRSAGQHRLQRWVYRLAHRVVANAKAGGDQLVREGVDRAAVALIPNGVDLAQYSPAPARAARRVVTTVANLRAEKGHDVLLRAAALVGRECPDARFQLVGAGPMREALEQDAARLGVNGVVSFLGHREDVPALLHESDLFVLPSRTEAFPNGIVEAMAAGLPVVASDVGGVPELVAADRTGILVPPGDPEALAAAILRLMREPEMCARYAAEARRVIEARYSFDRMVGQFEELYTSELATRRSPVLSRASAAA